MNLDLIIAAILSAIMSLQTSLADVTATVPVDLPALANTYCISADGNHDITASKALRDGFTPLRPEDFPGLRLPAARQLRGYSKSSGDVEIRVLTAANRFTGMGAGLTYHKVCWVSADPADRKTLERQLQTEFGYRGFRQLRTRVFAWFPQTDGTDLPVSRRQFQRYGHALGREQGMRMVMINDVDKMVAITYMTPTEDCEDWCH